MEKKEGRRHRNKKNLQKPADDAYTGAKCTGTKAFPFLGTQNGSRGDAFARSCGKEVTPDASKLVLDEIAEDKRLRLSASGGLMPKMKAQARLMQERWRWWADFQDHCKGAP
jgi:hypothetical protein